MRDYSLSKPYLPSKNSLFPPRVTFLAVDEFHARSLIRSFFYPWGKTGTTRSRMGTLHSKKSPFPPGVTAHARLIRSFLLSLSRETWGNTQFAASPTEQQNVALGQHTGNYQLKLCMPFVALQHGSFVPREWLLSKGLFVGESVLSSTCHLSRALALLSPRKTRIYW